MLKQILSGICTLVAVSSFSQKNPMKINYPVTKKVDTTDVYHGIKVPDPYRWLEDDRSDETSLWVDKQNEITNYYLDQIPFREKIRGKLEKIWNYERVSSPVKHGDYSYYSKNNGLQNQSVIYRIDKDGKEEVFLDPNTFSKDGTTSLGSLDFTKDGSLVAYSISEGGSDWRKVIVIDVKTKKQIGDVLTDIKFSGVSWKGNEGFYYSSYDKPAGSELSAKTDQHKLYFHKLNTPQKSDELVFGGDIKRRYVGGTVTDDQKFLVISTANATSGNELYVKDLKSGKITQLNEGFDIDAEIFHSDNDKFYIITNYNAKNKRVMTASVSAPALKDWKELIPETDNVLNVTTGGKYIFAHYMKDAIALVKQYDPKGTFLRDIELPGIGSIFGFSGEDEDKELYFTFTNYVTPPTIYKYDLEKNKSLVYRRPVVNFNPDLYESKQVFYPSRDGKMIPMIITYKKGTNLNGQNPTILYGYGGFNISLTPSFSVTTAAWLELGGIYAVANLRGGGEYGKKWHDDGTKLKKQNVFNDFIAAAEYLIEKNYTSKSYLAIRGGSNGGLLVGACMTQRPDLFKAAIPQVGVLDMLRYNKFTAGAGWAYDYGTAEDSPEMFEYLRKYSPLHALKKGVKYPATLVTTGDHDDRVVPAHSYKFAAELQADQAGDAPVLIRIDRKAGHGAGKSTAASIQENADIFSFILFQMDYEWKE
ncbi:MAG: S9 family peptidase [Flavobacteriia bacterium]|nr:S9 family peptidase [Flavobacteriia bacterium]OJX36121.1 MAG: S9 family peptidase [Flavobacteriia bacterium 40-80]